MQLIANKDDEYAVSSFCRFDDGDGGSDPNAGNEWEGAWLHSEPTEGTMGDYIFEMSRSLKTASTLTDAQLEPGDTIEFGVAYWDPNETEMGWTASGHFLTGCGTDWIDLVLEADSQNADGPSLTNGDGPALTDGSTSSAVSSKNVMAIIVAVVAALF